MSCIARKDGESPPTKQSNEEERERDKVSILAYYFKTLHLSLAMQEGTHCKDIFRKIPDFSFTGILNMESRIFVHMPLRALPYFSSASNVTRLLLSMGM